MKWVVNNIKIGDCKSKSASIEIDMYIFQKPEVFDPISFL